MLFLYDNPILKLLRFLWYYITVVPTVNHGWTEFRPYITFFCLNITDEYTDRISGLFRQYITVVLNSDRISRLMWLYITVVQTVYLSSEHISRLLWPYIVVVQTVYHDCYDRIPWLFRPYITIVTTVYHGCCDRISRLFPLNITVVLMPDRILGLSWP